MSSNSNASGNNASGGSNSGASGGRGGEGSGTKRKAEAPLIPVEFDGMDTATLRRYCRVNKLKPKSSKNKDDLVAAATKHWLSVNPKEVDTVAHFLYAVRHKHNVLKLTMPVPGA
ncbi:hypothetical protein DFQ27_002820 [Actinomortierella ambigua]|uniref:Histone deacetylase complex subunit SAP30 Sin3 binding domain-containing protein n=1 Tax=Actinomortierella ambigua TaxID=1343610 RepID=A0A9P6Q6D9_9FUNG|nr:hypothetical protein DFQ27_002820 [Actinomortierella ambigua]